jgi:hypothetical protein
LRVGKVWVITRGKSGKEKVEALQKLCDKRREIPKVGDILQPRFWLSVSAVELLMCVSLCPHNGSRIS